MFRSLIAGCVLGCITVLTLGFSSVGAAGSPAVRPASSHQGNSSQALGLKTLTRQSRFANEPVQIMSVWVNGQSIRLRNKPARFNEANDWLRGLVVRFKNVSDKPIAAVEFHLVVAEPGYSTTLITFTLKYGRTLSS